MKKIPHTTNGKGSPAAQVAAAQQALDETARRLTEHDARLAAAQAQIADLESQADQANLAGENVQASKCAQQAAGAVKFLESLRRTRTPLAAQVEGAKERLQAARKAEAEALNVRDYGEVDRRNQEINGLAKQLVKALQDRDAVFAAIETRAGQFGLRVERHRLSLDLAIQKSPAAAELLRALTEDRDRKTLTALDTRRSVRVVTS